jgi:hypothetical protein
MNVAIRWPDEDSREAVRLGTIVIIAVEVNDKCDTSIFNPANLAEGIGYPPDEIFAARRAADAISLARRRWSDRRKGSRLAVGAAMLLAPPHARADADHG